MFEIILAPGKGGSHQFKDLQAAQEWVIAERMALDDKFKKEFSGFNALDLQVLYKAWGALILKLRATPELDTEATVLRAPSYLMTAKSPVAQILVRIGQKLGAIAVQAAMYAADIPGEIDWSNPDALAGIQFYQLEFAKYVRDGTDNPDPTLLYRAESLNAQLDELNQRIVGLKADVSKVSNLSSAGTSSIESTLKQLSDGVEKTSAELMAGFRDTEARLQALAAASQSELARHDSQAQTFVAETRKRMDDWIEAQTEAVRLTAPVELWADRATNHQKTAKRLGIVALIAGGIGTILTPFISWGAFDSAHWLLSDAVEKGSGKAAQAVVAGIRQTLHFELIFTGTATLFWLTMFFWLMRIVVRRYSAEQRLAVDASGRAAMAQTYLGLIMESAAGETERPIVLEALFRPVVEAGRGEDGPPATSLASIVAAIVAGKSG